MKVAGEPRDVDGEVRVPVVFDFAVLGEFLSRASEAERRTLAHAAAQTAWSAGESS